jgi:hypothetical protein
VKIDWSPTATDKVWVRYSVQTHDVEPTDTVMPLAYSARSRNPYRGAGVSWNRAGNAYLTEVLLGYNGNEARSAVLDLQAWAP